MSSTFGHALGRSVSALAVATLFSGAALADPIPPGGQGDHVKAIGFSSLGGHYGAFKMALNHPANGRWYLYMGHSFDLGWSILDVTNPQDPKYLKFIPCDGPKDTITSQVTVHDNLMITSFDRRRPAEAPGVIFWDISDPVNPKQIAQWDSGGTGAHRNSYPGGKYAYLATRVNLDISDPTQPKLIGKLQITPPFASVAGRSVHTVLPIWDRRLLYVSSEAMAERCQDNGLNFAGLIDNSNPAKPRLISVFPPPRPPDNAPYRDFCDKGGRFGPHNTNQEIHNPAVAQPGDLMFIAYFNAGLRVFDISLPRLPTEVGYFIPPERSGLAEQSGPHASPVNWSEEVAVDTRGNIYLNDDKWGTFILQYTGKTPGKQVSKASGK